MDFDPWFEMSNDMLCEASLDGYLTRLNGAWERCLGFTSEELMSEPYVNLTHPDDLAATLEAAGGLASDPSEVVGFENRYRKRDGGWCWLQWNCRSDGEKIYGVARDITERKQLEAEREQLLARVEAMARTDVLTGLPNRRAWEEELRQEIHRARRNESQLGVALLDIDRFKAFNDTYGHQAGDTLLRDAAAAWRLTLRMTDFIARHGGEEFGVLLPGCPPRDGVAALDRLRAQTPGGQTISGGLAIWDGEESPEALMARADEALYRAKSEGRNTFALAR